MGTVASCYPDHPDHDVNQCADIFSGRWVALREDILSQWTEFSRAECDEIAASPSKLSRALKAHFGLTSEEALTLILELADRYDSLGPNLTPSIVAEKARQIWAELRPSDLNAVAPKRSALVTLIAQRYGLTRAGAWRQVNAFLDQILRSAF